jgi:dihydrofolate reductase
LLGRTTYEQMSGWFQPGHVPVVLTRQTGYIVEGGWAVSSVRAAVALASSHGAEELLVCGGGQVYRASLPAADEIILTTVDVDLPDGVRFPEWSALEWTVMEQETFPANAENSLALTITRLVRNHGTG